MNHGKLLKSGGYRRTQKMLAVVITDAAEIGEFRFERRKFGAAYLQSLLDWMVAEGCKKR